MTAFDILIENATTFAERRKLTSLLESERANVDAAMVTNLYRSAINKSHINFDSIPESKGDITKYEGYKSMRESLEIVRSLANSAKVKVPELDTLDNAISIIGANAPKFTKGFLLRNEAVILLYNTLVLACVESTSLIISSYVDFVKNPNSFDFRLVKNARLTGELSITNLELFVESYNKGDFSKFINSAIEQKDNFIGTAITAATLYKAILGTALAASIVPIMRELVFGFYYTRVQVSEYLEQQARLIEIHRRNIESSQLPSNERKAIIAKQEKKANQLLQLSDKIRISANKGSREAVHEIKKENKNWTIDSVQSQTASNDGSGFTLL